MYKITLLLSWELLTSESFYDVPGTEHSVVAKTNTVFVPRHLKSRN